MKLLSWNAISRPELASTTPVNPPVVNKNKKPIVGERLKLVNDKNEVVWESVTDNLGNAELWINPMTDSEQNIGKYILKDQSNNIISNNPK